MTLDELKQIVAANGKLDGYDFSHINTGHAPVPWDYVDIARRYLKPTDRVLDIGTGGGEIFYSLSSCFGKGVCVDPSPDMARTAMRNRSTLRLNHISVLRMWAGDLAFEANSFDVVLTRHVGVYVSEIVRVLRPGGFFISQTVGQRTSLNILKAFDWTPSSFGPDWWQSFSDLADQFRSYYGCHVHALAEYDVPIWYQDMASFMVWFMAVPWPEEIELDKHWQNINRVIETCQTERGIETNEHRELLIVQKMGN
jgi:SAM-dependent methyltransferase